MAKTGVDGIMRHWLSPLLQLLIRILTAIEGQKSKLNDFGFWTIASTIWFDSTCCLQGAQRRAAGFFWFAIKGIQESSRRH